MCLDLPISPWELTERGLNHSFIVVVGSAGLGLQNWSSLHHRFAWDARKVARERPMLSTALARDVLQRDPKADGQLAALIAAIALA
ncbi:hypothetical protein XA68_13349 [Ophiocordyceps unilateralis]|uniref:Uncharacterized protein n=1 Tax=Ophiocordyceps unilateralis TaxID=268505 RepID=A0A2A9PCX3_OPHUN|nr:hypothetical protein XA68_13349 [Ophiocordyceps unilateralis]